MHCPVPVPASAACGSSSRLALLIFDGLDDRRRVLELVRSRSRACRGRDEGHTRGRAGARWLGVWTVDAEAEAHGDNGNGCSG